MKKKIFLCLIVLVLMGACTPEENISKLESNLVSECVAVSPKGFLEIQDEYKDLDVGKSICSVNDSNGYVVDILVTNAEKEFSIQIIEKDDFRRIIRKTNNDQLSIMDNVLFVDDKIYSLNESNKTYFELIEYDGVTKLFSGLKYIETSNERIENIEYIVDKFSYKSDENVIIKFYIKNGKIDFIVIIDDKEYILKLSITEGVSLEFPEFPDEYTKVGLRNTIEQYIFVPDSLKNTLLGKTFQNFDLDNGFSLSFNSFNSDNKSCYRGYSYIFKGNMAYFSEYYYNGPSDNGYVREELYKNGKKYSVPFSVIEDPIGTGLGIDGFFLDGYEYKETFFEDCLVEEKDITVSCQVERYENKNEEIVDFYFESNTLLAIVKNDEVYYVQLLTGENVDKSAFERFESKKTP